MKLIEPYTTTHGSIPAETGKNDGDRTSGDCISRQVALEAIRTLQTYKLFAGDDMILIDKAEVQTELMMLPSVQPEPCEDAVSKEAVLSMIDTYMNKSVELHYLPTSDGIKKLISILPPVQPERKKGKWVYDNGLKQFFCDQCGEPSLTYDDIYIYSMDFTNFCPNCGADMKGEQE